MPDDDPQIHPFTVIPAPPGWNVATFWEREGDQPPRFHLDPIIAWIIEHQRYHHSVAKDPSDRFHNVAPITLDGRPSDDRDDWCIRHPDGRCEITFVWGPGSESEALAYFQEQHDQKIAGAS